MRSRRSVIALLAAGGTLVVVLAVWGITAKVAPMFNSELTIDEWVIRADDICMKAQAAADANPAPQSPLPGDELRLTSTRSRAELEQLRKIDQPSERKSAVAEYLITLDHRNDELENYAKHLDETPSQAPKPSREHLEELTTQAYTQGVALGLEHCNGGVDFTVDITTTLVPALTQESTIPLPTTPGGQLEGEENTVDQPG